MQEVDEMSEERKETAENTAEDTEKKTADQEPEKKTEEVQPDSDAEPQKVEKAEQLPPEEPVKKTGPHPRADIPPVNAPRRKGIRWDLIGKLCAAGLFCGLCGFGGGVLANHTGIGETEKQTVSDAERFFSEFPGYDDENPFDFPQQDGSDTEEDSGFETDTPALGVTVQQISGQDGYEDGVYVMAISEGSKAAEAGLEEGDRIVRADDTEVSENTDLSGVISEKEVGDTVDLLIERDGEELTVEVELVSKASLTTETNRRA